jgi:hypothetical protein
MASEYGLNMTALLVIGSILLLFATLHAAF